MKFAVAALLATVAAHKGDKPHPHPHPSPSPKPQPDLKKEFMMDMKFIAEELKGIDGDLKKLDKIEWIAEKEHEKEEHHRHHRPDHRRPDHRRPHHRRPHHGKHHKKENVKIDIDVVKAEKIIEGVLKGAADAEGLTDISHCIQDLQTAITDAENAVGDFKKGGASNVIAGLKQVGDMLKYVKSGMQDCSSTQADWAKIEQMAKNMSSPQSFAYHVGKDLIINGNDIFNDIADSIQDYDNKQWQEFGIKVGEAAAKTILGAENGTCRDNGDKASCDAAGCSWCTSFAVKDACNSIEDAKKLPSAVFVCDNLSADLFLH